jgi:threonine dehydrogenase-like Zn-dependent dehydrogenase
VLDTAFQLIKPGGSILLFSGYVYGSTYTIDLNKTHYRQIQINTAIDCTIQQFRQSAELLPGLGLEDLVTKVFPLNEVVPAFEATRDRDVIKVVIEP